VVRWDVEVISRPFDAPKWDVRTSELAEIPAEWKGFFRSIVNLTMPYQEIATELTAMAEMHKKMGAMGGMAR
jgi:hypothetical protein